MSSRINIKSMCVLEWSAASARRSLEGLEKSLESNRSSSAADCERNCGSRRSVRGSQEVLYLAISRREIGQCEVLLKISCIGRFRSRLSRR